MITSDDLLTPIAEALALWLEATGELAELANHEAGELAIRLARISNLVEAGTLTPAAGASLVRLNAQTSVATIAEVKGMSRDEASRTVNAVVDAAKGLLVKALGAVL